MSKDNGMTYSEKWKCWYGEVHSENEVQLAIEGYHTFVVSWEDLKSQQNGKKIYALQSPNGFHRCHMLELINDWNKQASWKYYIFDN